MVEPGPGDDEGLILRGSIEETSVPELLKSVLGSGETGVLTFRKGDLTKSVHLHMGRVVYARSSDPDERLGEDLLLRGKISVRQYLDASRLIAPGRRLGTILVELGALEPEDLIGAIEHHVKQILLDVFTWTHGEYELVMTEPGKSVGREDVRHREMKERFERLLGLRHVIASSWELQGWWHGAAETLYADIVMAPRIYNSQVSGYDFSAYNEMIEAGRKASEEKLDFILKSVASLLKPGVP